MDNQVTFSISRECANRISSAMFDNFGVGPQTKFTKTICEIYQPLWSISDKGPSNEQFAISVSKKAVKMFLPVLVGTYYDFDQDLDNEESYRESINEMYSAMIDALDDPKWDESAILSRLGRGNG